MRHIWLPRQPWRQLAGKQFWNFSNFLWVKPMVKPTHDPLATRTQVPNLLETFAWNSLKKPLRFPTGILWTRKLEGVCATIVDLADLLKVFSKHAGRVLWVNAQTCKKPSAFENGPEARETHEQRSSARTRAKPEGVCATQFLISVVNNLD
jgi:hypothetical protein